jgi:parallel beta-helix repeat protein
MRSRNFSSDSKDGRSPSNAWKTIAHVNSSTLSAGDSVLFNKGCTWREQLTVPSSGSAGNVIAIGSYGSSGAAPIINGADLVTSWTAQVSSAVQNVYTSSVTTQPASVVFDGVVGNAKGSIINNDLTSNDDWYWTSNTLYIYSATDPAGRTIEAAKRDYGMTMNNKSYVTVQNLDIRNANLLGIHLSAWLTTYSHVTVDGCTLQNNYQSGVHIVADGGYAIDSVTIKNSIAHGNGEAGISGGVGANVSNILIQGNTVYSNSWRTDSVDWGGIKVFGSTMTNVTIEDNDVFNNGDAQSSYKTEGGANTGDGIYVDTIGSGVVIRCNRVHDNHRSGIFIEKSDGVAAYHNISYNNGQSGIYIFDKSHYNLIYSNTVYGNRQGLRLDGLASSGGLTGNILKNNISFANTGTEGNASEYTLMVQNGGENDGTNGSGNVYLYNALGPEATNFINWGGVNKSTYAAFDTAYGSSTNSVAGDPKFTNAAGNDLTLQSASPAINAGTDLGSSYQNGLDPRTSFPWSTVSQNSYGSGWEIGAFVYLPQ